jgi:hypothetical protein
MRNPKQIYVEVSINDEVVQVHWNKESVVKKYSAGTMSRMYRVLSRSKSNSGVLIKGNLWCKIPYKEGISLYEVEHKAIRQTRDLKLRYLFGKLAHRNIKKDISDGHVDELINKIENYFKKV